MPPEPIDSSLHSLLPHYRILILPQYRASRTSLSRIAHQWSHSSIPRQVRVYSTASVVLSDQPAVCKLPPSIVVRRVASLWSPSINVHRSSTTSDLSSFSWTTLSNVRLIPASINVPFSTSPIEHLGDHMRRNSRRVRWESRRLRSCESVRLASARRGVRALTLDVLLAQVNEVSGCMPCETHMVDVILTTGLQRRDGP